MDLVGGFNPSETYEFVSWDDYSQYMETKKTCSKPPTSYGYLCKFDQSFKIWSNGSKYIY